MSTSALPESIDMHDDQGHELAIRVRGLVNRFGSQTVHEDLDLDVRRGEILGVVGGSGTGKSVLMPVRCTSCWRVRQSASQC